MTLDVYIPFLLFVLVMTGTPGMGNLSMLAIGQATGFRSALPFLAGTTAGALTLNLGVSLGLGGIVAASPVVALALKVGGGLYILYLAWKLLTMQFAPTDAVRRFTFVDGLFLHPLNPKSWAMSVVGFGMLVDPAAPMATQVAAFVGTFLVFQVSCHSLWGWAGAALLRGLKSRTVLLGVNLCLVTVMVGATMYALFV